MERLKEVLAVVNNKGGVGKTTTVQSLAAALVRMDKKLRVLVIDLDPQMHLSILHGWNQADDYFTTPTIYTAMRNGSSLPVYRTTRDGVYMVPGDDTLQDVDSDLIRQMNPKRVLQKCFGLPIDDHTDRECPKGEKVQPSVGSWKECEKEGLTTIIESFDYVLIDCAPALSQSTYNAMTVASGLLIPGGHEGSSVRTKPEPGTARSVAYDGRCPSENCSRLHRLPTAFVWRFCLQDDDTPLGEDERGADAEKGYLRLQVWSVEQGGQRLREAD